MSDERPEPHRPEETLEPCRAGHSACSRDAEPAPQPREVPEDRLNAYRAATPARVLTGRAGSSYRSQTLLGLRLDHAAARDAVRAEIDLERDLGAEFVHQWSILELGTTAGDKDHYLRDPEAGRRLSDSTRETLRSACPSHADLQIVIGDGLSAAAVVAQVPVLLPPLAEGAASRGWTLGRPLFLRHCRVGVINDVGLVLQPTVVVLLIGERPGLAAADSLSAYMAYRPRPGHTDADRNLISNIHTRGLDPPSAAHRILALAATLRASSLSGTAVKESLPPSSASSPPTLSAGGRGWHEVPGER